MPDLVDVRPLIAEAIFDLRYTTDRNVLGRPLHHDPRVLLRSDAAQALTEAARLFKEQSLRVVIWDAYRTPEVQLMLQAFNSDPRYVLGPDSSNHPKGLAVDMTLADRAGQQLDMGTDFDDFSSKAHVDTDLINSEQKSNRQLMADVMTGVGFRQLPTEWWHFDYQK